MKKPLPDEQLDQMMRTLISDAALDDTTVNEIADSPTMWWAIQRQINRQKEAGVSAWPPVTKFWKWLIVGVPMAAAAALLISLFVLRSTDLPDKAGIIPVNNVQTAQNTSGAAGQEPVGKDAAIARSEDKPASQRRSSAAAAKFTAASRRIKQVLSTPMTAKAKATDIKTDFIALSYARNPESGQIVRVKVPSSMMVTLGLVASVEKPSNLIDAEVVVGDDGLARAIRFIH